MYHSGSYARIRFLDEGERKEQHKACRTDVGLCADTTYAIVDVEESEGKSRFREDELPS